MARTSSDPWAGLRWPKLVAWVGTRTVERGQAYQKEGRVKRLTRADDGRLLATVYGTERYFVAVSPPEKGVAPRPRSECTCPVGVDCKHAVATIAAYQQALANHARVPEADADDPRWKKIRDSLDQDPEWDDAAEFDEPQDWGETGDEDEPGFAAKRPSTPPRKSLDKSLAVYLATRSPTELIALLVSLAERFSEVRLELHKARRKDEDDSDHPR